MLTAGDLFHSFVLTCMLVGFYNHLFVHEANNCEMTWMYEYPQYQLVPVQANQTYKLYLYGEGGYFEHVRTLNVHGIPVIFVPGHGGSYKQARSLGSILLRKALRQELNHFNVFTIDFNEEWVGLCGETLRDQSRFLQSSIKAVLSLYKSSKPRSVILVGHSIGGVIARSLFLLDDFDVSSVSIILTFASPNLAPVVSADYNVAQFYQEVKLYWKLNADKMKNISVLSVSGGDNDVQVRHSLTRLPTEQANHLSTSLYTIPRVQLTTDHLAVVWCKQLVLVTSRFLFSLIDKNTRQMTENTEKRNLLMSYYFGSSYQSINSSLILNVKLKLSSAYLRKTVSQLSWSEKLDKEDVGVYYTFDIKQYLDQNATDFVAEISLQHKQWILVSGENYTGVRDISSHSFHSGKSQRIRFDLRWLFEKGFFNVLIRVPKNKPIDHLSVNVLRPGEYVVIDVPNVFSNIWTLGKGFNYSLDSKTRFYYRLRLNGISNVHQNFDVRLHDPLGYFELETSWDKGLSLNGSNKINVKLRNVPAADDIVILHVYTSLPNPELTIRANFVGLLTQLCRHFSTCLPVLMVANLLLTYSYLIKQHKVEIINQELSQAHSIGAKPYKVVPFVSLIHFLYSYDWFANTWRTFGLPLPDTHLLQNEHQVWFGLAPLVLFFFAYELFVVEMKLQSIINYFLTFAMKLFPIKFHDYVYNAKYFRASFHILFLSALMSINYSLALFYMYVASVFGTCCMSLVENSMRRKDGSNSKGMKHRISNTSMRIITSQIWLWLFLYNLPSLLFAVKRQTSLLVGTDLFFYHTLLAAGLFVLEVFSDSSTIKRKFLVKFHLPVVVLLVATSLYSLHRASGFLLLFLVMHALSVL